jgi:neutral ceramidase
MQNTISLKAGLAKAVITPPVGVRLCGYAARTQPSTGILDDLYAKALVLDDGQERFALVVCDLLWVGKELVNDTKKRIREQTGIKEENVMMAAIHTHTGPDLEYAGEPYIENLKSQMAGAVSAACNRMKKTRIGVAVGECYVGMNRRNPKSPFGPYFLYNWPQGPVDPKVMVLRIEDESGHVMGVLVNHACHPVTLGPNELNISRDYPGYALRVLEDVFGEDIIAMFMNGCCGNINPAWIYDRPDVSPPPPRVFHENLEERTRETRRLGQILGGEALKALQSVTNFVSEADLKIKRSKVRLPVRKDIPENILERTKGAKTGEPRDELYQRILRHEDVITEIQAVQLNDTALLGLPGEIFVEYQLETRRRSPIKHTFISELANDSIGYVPTANAYKEGGYEPGTTILERNAGTKLTRAAINLLKNLDQ